MKIIGEEDKPFEKKSKNSAQFFNFINQKKPSNLEIHARIGSRVANKSITPKSDVGGVMSAGGQRILDVEQKIQDLEQNKHKILNKINYAL